MLKVLTDNLPPPSQFTPHFSKRLIFYEQSPDSVIMHFADGSMAEADILIGADGIRSATRAAMYRHLSNRMEGRNLVKASDLFNLARSSWTGTYGYRALVETKTLLSRYPGHQAASHPMLVRILILYFVSSFY